MRIEEGRGDTDGVGSRGAQTRADGECGPHGESLRGATVLREGHVEVEEGNFRLDDLRVRGLHDLLRESVEEGLVREGGGEGRFSGGENQVPGEGGDVPCRGEGEVG